MGSRARPGRRSDPTRDRRVEVEDSEVGVEITLPGRGLGARLRRQSSRWGDFILILDRVASTNDVARDYARHGAPHGSLFIAREQTAGRGRFGRTWESGPGGLYFSVLLEPRAGDPVALLPHLTAVAAAEALIETTDLDVKLRWPNDLYTNGLKLGGILCEGSFRGSDAEAFIAGIGINVNQKLDTFPPEVQERATVLSEHGLDESVIAARIVERLETWWQIQEPARIVARFRELAEGATGRAIRVYSRDREPYQAVTCGIADDGGLIVRVVDEKLGDADERILYSEDVVQLRDENDRAPRVQS